MDAKPATRAIAVIAIDRNRFLSGCLLILCLMVISGLTTTVCALAAAQAAHACCDGAATGADAEGSEGDCHCPSCTPVERSAGRLPLSLAEIRFTFPVQNFLTPRLLRSTAIDYPPEII